ncbi:MAG: Xaa-Pro peptidase family protein [Chloroherpetonaceae bacterium]
MSKSTTKVKAKEQTKAPVQPTPKTKRPYHRHIIEEEAKSIYPEKIDLRLKQILFALEAEKAQGIYVSYLPNIHYLTNFSGSSAHLFILQDEIHFITDDRYEEQIKHELYALPNLKTHITRDLWNYVIEAGFLNKVDTIAFEADRLSYYESVETRNKLRPVKFKPTPALVEPFTQSKSPEEIAYIRKACEISEAVFKEILEFIKPGMSEHDVAVEIAYRGRLLGAEDDAFEIIVTSGERGALVHGAPTNKRIRKGDIVLMDYGFKVHGFCSDITRTICVGDKPTKYQKTVYAMLRNAEVKAINSILPAVNGKYLDMVARKIINEAGLGAYFQHSLGHGIGLAEHENPVITFRQDDQIVPEDSVIAIEPGVYLPDKFGMRVEDDVLVTANGPVWLTNAPDELLSVL